MSVLSKSTTYISPFSFILLYIPYSVGTSTFKINCRHITPPWQLFGTSVRNDGTKDESCFTMEGSVLPWTMPIGPAVAAAA